MAINKVPRAQTPLVRSVSLMGGWHRVRFYWFQRVFGKLFFSRRNGMGPKSAEIESGRMAEESQQLAIVDETIVPYFGGRVRFQSSWWPALCLHNITLGPGEVVCVVGRHNITLLVEPMGASLQRRGND